MTFIAEETAHTNSSEMAKSVTGATQVQSPSFFVEDHHQSPVHKGTWMGLELFKASPYRVAALAACPFSNTVAQMKSFIGAFKVLSRVISGCSTLLINLGDAVAGRESKESIQWTVDLHSSFTKHRQPSHKLAPSHYPDQLWIVTDGAVRTPGIVATLYLSCAGKLHLAEFFSAKNCKVLRRGSYLAT